MVIAEGYEWEGTVNHDGGFDTARYGDNWMRPLSAVQSQAPELRTKTALRLARYDLEVRIAFLERICAEANLYQNRIIATRYARTLRDMQAELTLLSPPGKR